jgi:AraC-like DNA-binding protein
MDISGSKRTELRLSTRDMPETERIVSCREMVAQRMPNLNIEPVPGVSFHAESTFRSMRGLQTVKWTGSAICVKRKPSEIDAVALIVNQGKCAQVLQRGREVVLSAGEATAVLQSDAVDLTNASLATPHGYGSHLALVVPHSALASRVGDVEATLVRPVSRRRESLRLLLSYLPILHRQAFAATPELTDVVVGHVHDLIALTVGPGPEPGESSLSAIGAARLEVALGEIARRFHDPDFSIRALAHSQGVSSRYLQRLLEMSGLPFTARLNEHRLQRAFALLTQEKGCSVARIADVALSVGFSDISHFNRLFRARFGDSPTGVRRSPTLGAERR